MASTNKTKNIGLNQWVASDPVLRADFNADNEKIDAAIGSVNAALDTAIDSLNTEMDAAIDGLNTELNAVRSGQLKVTTGSYKGTSASGASNTNTLSFDFEPLLVIISYTGYTAIFVKDHPNACVFGSLQQAYNSSNYGWYISPVTWSGNTVSWYSTDTSAGPSSQLNHNAYTYNYIALGL